MSTTTTNATLARESYDTAQIEAELLARAGALTERALARGAQEAETFAVKRRSIAVRFEKGDLKLTQVDEGSTLGLRVFQGGRLGFSSTNQADERSLDATASAALELAAFARPDPHNRLPAARPVTKLAPLLERALAQLSVEEAVELGRAFLARVASHDKRISIDSGHFQLECATHAIHTSSGIALAESDGVAGFQVFGMALEGEDVAGFHYDGDSVRTRAALEPAMERVARDFAEAAVGNLGAQAAESYTGPVLFAPDAFYDVFVEPLLAAASAIAVQRKRSPLAGKLQSSIASSLVSITDEPHERTLAGAGSFDREGQPTARTPIVEGGVLRTFLYNAYAATVEGRLSTGHAGGGARGVPSLAAHAISVAPGAGGSREQVLGALGRGLFVQRFSGTVDAASGDFSGVAKSARWVEGGKVVRSLRETLLSGNAYALLPRVKELSSVRERLMGANVAPYAIVERIAVTAG